MDISTLLQLVLSWILTVKASTQRRKAKWAKKGKVSRTDTRLLCLGATWLLSEFSGIATHLQLKVSGFWRFTCVSHFSHCCSKTFRRSSWREERFILAPGLRGSNHLGSEGVMVGGSVGTRACGSLWNRADQEAERLGRKKTTSLKEELNKTTRNKNSNVKRTWRKTKIRDHSV